MRMGFWVWILLLRADLMIRRGEGEGDWLGGLGWNVRLREGEGGEVWRDVPESG